MRRQFRRTNLANPEYDNRFEYEDRYLPAILTRAHSGILVLRWKQSDGRAPTATPTTPGRVATHVELSASHVLRREW